MKKTVELDALPDEGEEFCCIWIDELGLNCNVFLIGREGSVLVLQNDGVDFRRMSDGEKCPWECLEDYRLIGEEDD